NYRRLPDQEPAPPPYTALFRSPVLATINHAVRGSEPVYTHTWPCRWLYRTAFSTRLPASRSSRLGSPTTGAGRRSVVICRLIRRSEEHTTELQSRDNLVCCLLL